MKIPENYLAMQSILLFFHQSTRGYDLMVDICTTCPIWPSTRTVFVEYSIAMVVYLYQDTQMVPVIEKNAFKAMRKFLKIAPNIFQTSHCRYINFRTYIV